MGGLCRRDGQGNQNIVNIATEFRMSLGGRTRRRSVLCTARGCCSRRRRRMRRLQTARDCRHWSSSSCGTASPCSDQRARCSRVSRPARRRVVTTCSVTVAALSFLLPLANFSRSLLRLRRSLLCLYSCSHHQHVAQMRDCTQIINDSYLFWWHPPITACPPMPPANAHIAQHCL